MLCHWNQKALAQWKVFFPTFWTLPLVNFIFHSLFGLGWTLTTAALQSKVLSYCAAISTLFAGREKTICLSKNNLEHQHSDNNIFKASLLMLSMGSSKNACNLLWEKTLKILNNSGKLWWLSGAQFIQLLIRMCIKKPRFSVISTFQYVLWHATPSEHIEMCSSQKGNIDRDAELEWTTAFPMRAADNTIFNFFKWF